MQAAWVCSQGCLRSEALHNTVTVAGNILPWPCALLRRHISCSKLLLGSIRTAEQWKKHQQRLRCSMLSGHSLSLAQASKAGPRDTCSLPYPVHLLVRDRHDHMRVSHTACASAALR